MRIACMALAFTSVATPPGGGGLPAAVAARFAAIVHPSRSASFAGTFRVSTVTVVADREEIPLVRTEMTVEVERRTDGTRRAYVDQATQNGKDVSFEMREAVAAAGGRPSPGHGDIVVRTPYGPDAALYAVGRPYRRGRWMAADFHPAGGDGIEGLARGTLAWDPTSLDPAWAYYELERPTRDMDRTALRFDFALQDGTSYVTHVHVQGSAGAWIFRREYDMQLTVSDIHREVRVAAR